MGGGGAGAFTVPANGTYVLVFFENGNPMSPRYMGSIPGQPSGVPEKPPRNAFPSDPPGGVQDPGPLPDKESNIMLPEPSEIALDAKEVGGKDEGLVLIEGADC
jgi:uncharacterized protein involved in type VI secretion and phage assembly